MSETQRVLIVSFFYPPNPAVGGLRVAKFAQYLPEFGWTPTVLTARSEAVSPSEPGTNVHATRYVAPFGLPRGSAPADAAGRRSLRERAACRGRFTRAAYAALRHLLPMSSVRMPDATLGWLPFGVAEGRRLLDSGDFQAIFSSSGPPSSHIVAARLQRYSGLPWIADYRDPWSDNHWDNRIGAFRLLERRLERRVLRAAALLTTVAPTWASQLRELHGHDVEVVYNGFDPADYPSEPQTTDRFTLTYVGSLIRPHESPEPLFQALARLKSRPDLDLDGSGFQIRFLGTAPGAAAELAERYGVAHLVSYLPPVSHRECLAQQAAAAALLFLGWSDPERGVITAKLFEYLGAGRPILAVGPPGGEVSRILRECGLPDLTDDPQTIARRLEAWLSEFADSGKLAAQTEGPAIKAYTRRAQAQRLAQLLDKAA
ncbi:MAG: glycosyltransferase [Gemmatimonadota bacterium]|nr:MAG: glycosyltransferase [Gemmatimonadota bacterium]